MSKPGDHAIAYINDAKRQVRQMERTWRGGIHIYPDSLYAAYSEIERRVNDLDRYADDLAAWINRHICEEEMKGNNE